MSDTQGGWQAPESGPDRDRPRYGEYAPAASPGGSPLPPPPMPLPTGAPAGGWAPPPKPGLIPLRPLGFGALLSTPFKVLRNSRPLIGLAILLQFVVLVAGGGVMVAVLLGGLGRVTDFEDPDQQALIAGGIAGGVVGAVIVMALNLVVSALLQGFVVVDVSRGVLGQRSTLRDLWRRVRPHLWRLIGWTGLIFVATLLAFGAIAGVIAIGAVISPIGLVISIVIAVVLGLGLAALFIWLSVRLSLVPSLVVLERLRLRPAIRRSWGLIHRYFWRTFGVQAIITVVISFAAQVVTAPVSFLPLLGIVIDPNGTGATEILSVVSIILSSVVSIVIAGITSVVISSAIALIYVDLRMRKEGLDLVLQRFVESPDDSRDPYEPGAV